MHKLKKEYEDGFDDFIDIELRIADLMEGLAPKIRGFVDEMDLKKMQTRREDMIKDIATLHFSIYVLYVNFGLVQGEGEDIIRDWIRNDLKPLKNEDLDEW